MKRLIRSAILVTLAIGTSACDPNGCSKNDAQSSSENHPVAQSPTAQSPRPEARVLAPSSSQTQPSGISGIDGNWKAVLFQGGGGPTAEANGPTFAFKVNGEKLTGTMSHWPHDEEIASRSVKGDELSFTVFANSGISVDMIDYKGKIVSADEIHLTMQHPLAPGVPGRDGKSSSNASNSSHTCMVRDPMPTGSLS